MATQIDSQGTLAVDKPRLIAALWAVTISIVSSWFEWLKWSPTSMAALHLAEKRLLSNLKTLYRDLFVPITAEHQVRTVVLNETTQDKTPLVVLHGFAAGVGLWCLNLDAFAEKRPVYAIDWIGFGRSSRPNFSKNALEAEAQFVESLEEWRKKMGLEKVVMMGHSMGGFLASAYALKYPETVKHLILADPWGFPEVPPDSEFKKKLPWWVRGIAFVLSPFNPLSIVRVSGPLGPRLVKRARPDITKKFSAFIPNADDAIPDYIYHCNSQSPTGEGGFHAMMAQFGWAKFPMISRIEGLHSDVSLTFIYGARSWVDRKPGLYLQEKLKDRYVAVKCIDGAGHHVYADRPDVFNGLVIEACDFADSVEIDDLERNRLIEQGDY